MSVTPSIAEHSPPPAPAARRRALAADVAGPAAFGLDPGGPRGAPALDPAGDPALDPTVADEIPGVAPTIIGTRLAEGTLYRPGRPFTAAELQSLIADGALHRVVADVHAPIGVRPSMSLRARAMNLLLADSPGVDPIVCGEAAAWVHHGGAAPSRLTVVTRTAHRVRRSAGLAWQFHQVGLDDEDVMEVRRLPVTTPLRTAGDLFLGVGTSGGRRSLDDHPKMPPLPPLSFESSAQERAALLADALEDTPGEAWSRRGHLLGRMLDPEEGAVTVEELVEHLLDRVCSRRDDPARAARIEETAAQCASRRFPTVR